MHKLLALLTSTILFLAASVSAQTVEAYGENKSEGKFRLIDPSKLTVNHGLSFGMASYSGVSGLKSQSLYHTMMTYEFSKPVTLNLNFGLPIHSTFYSGHNLNAENLQSLDYFKNMPINASLLWQPSERFAMFIGISHNTGNSYYHDPFSPFFSPFSPNGDIFERRIRPTRSQMKKGADSQRKIKK